MKTISIKEIPSDIKYKLKPLDKDALNIFKVTIVADENDADYKTMVEYYTEEEFESIIDELININDNYSETEKFREYPNEFDISIPYGSNGRCHTLESIDIEYIDENSVLWKVELVEQGGIKECF